MGLLNMEIIVLLFEVFYIALSPFNKVEESFNTQATHDILYYGTSIHNYDHVEFPGVVPRTFIGPIILSFVSWPFLFLINIFGLSKMSTQYIVRFVLGVLVYLSWRKLHHSLSTKFGRTFTTWFTLITCTQFHFLYYGTRLLPNTFALIFALLALSYWLDQRHQLMVWTCGIAVVIFRAELSLLLGPMLLYDLYQKHIGISQMVKYLATAGIVCILSTIIIDSIFWGELVWPEGKVLWFNIYLNQSRHWGIYPFLWYWYSALPRALGFTYAFAVVGFAIDVRVRVVTLPALVFIALYSFLPHKELRFILYSLPFFNIAAARACEFFWNNRKKSVKFRILALGSCGHLLANFALTALLASVSSMNYPGGEAMSLLHRVVNNTDNVHVHIGNLAAQTGASRFTQLHDHWRYCKTEHLTPGSQDIMEFTHLLVEAKSKYAYNLKKYTETHEIIGFVESYSHMNLNYNSFPPIKIRVKPSIYLLRNLDLTEKRSSAAEPTVEEDLDKNQAGLHTVALPDPDPPMQTLTLPDIPGEAMENL